MITPAQMPAQRPVKVDDRVVRSTGWVKPAPVHTGLEARLDQLQRAYAKVDHAWKEHRNRKNHEELAYNANRRAIRLSQQIAAVERQLAS